MKRYLIALLAFGFLFTGCQSVTNSPEYQALQAENESLTAQVSQLQDSSSSFEGQVSELQTQMDSLNSENADLKTANDQLQKQLDDLQNGAANLIIEVRKDANADNDSAALSAADQLHLNFPGTDEDVEAQAIAADLRAQQEKAKQDAADAAEKLAADAAKSAQDKAYDLVTITKLTKSKPNSAGGVDLYIGFKNRTDKVIKYISFDVQAINAVGDPATCEIRGYSVFSGRATGPYKKGEGLAGTSSGYWENAWYNWGIDRVILKTVDIQYMDGSSVSNDGEEFNYQWK